MRRALAAIAAVGVLAVPTAGTTHAQAPTTVSSSLLAELDDAAATLGLSLDELLDATVEVRRFEAGRWTTTSQRLGDVIDAMAIDATVAGPGAADTPAEATIGHQYHLYVSVGTGSQLAYDVSTSSVAPVLPVVSPASIHGAHKAGGPLTQIRANDYDSGFHLAGTSPQGYNLDTAGTGPTQPVWAPPAVAVIVDTDLEFIGHVDALLQTQYCVFGTCVATGLFLGDGVTVYDDQTDTDLPTLP